MASSTPKKYDLPSPVSGGSLGKDFSFWANLHLVFSVSLHVLWRVTGQILVTHSGNANSVMTIMVHFVEFLIH